MKAIIVLTTPALAAIAFYGSSNHFGTCLTAFIVLGLLQAYAVTKVLYGEG